MFYTSSMKFFRNLKTIEFPSISLKWEISFKIHYKSFMNILRCNCNNQKWFSIYIFVIFTWKIFPSRIIFLWVTELHLDVFVNNNYKSFFLLISIGKNIFIIAENWIFKVLFLEDIILLLGGIFSCISLNNHTVVFFHYIKWKITKSSAGKWKNRWKERGKSPFLLHCWITLRMNTFSLFYFQNFSFNFHFATSATN